ncbi:Bifunctional inhibitor/lipid-transfer protein/seed storage 2S albumin superfamily protein [Raphanus sativus]|nr:Bifunctional inhibitor/lipid-transfer protein/seed storage 2S albumin superfamily protein [Raphanus sativus]
MKSSKLSSISLCFILICIIFFPQKSFSCGSCNPRKGGKHSTKPPVTVPKLPVPPVTVPKLPVPPVTVPKLPVPPVTVPKLPVPPVTVPELPLPPVGGLPIPPVGGLPIPPVGGLPIPPVGGLPIPPVGGLPTLPLPPLPIVGPLLPPGTTPPSSGGKDCPPPPGSHKSPPGTGKATCPIDTLKLGACVDLLGGLVKIGLGDPAVNKCCPILKGLAEVEAAACLCTTLKLKALNLKLFFLPVAKTHLRATLAPSEKFSPVKG